jgi:hypothetical protein
MKVFTVQMVKGGTLNDDVVTIDDVRNYIINELEAAYIRAFIGEVTED